MEGVTPTTSPPADKSPLERARGRGRFCDCDLGVLHIDIKHLPKLQTADGDDDQRYVANSYHRRMLARFDEFLAERANEPLHLTEICTAIGAPERTLRACCQEHLGMGPIRYLWLRRMRLANRALLQADSASASVTSIAAGQGFWELGKFSVAYRSLFGESPSETLRRRPQDRPVPTRSPFTLPSAESA